MLWVQIPGGLGKPDAVRADLPEEGTPSQDPELSPGMPYPQLHKAEDPETSHANLFALRMEKLRLREETGQAHSQVTSRDRNLGVSPGRPPTAPGSEGLWAWFNTLLSPT